MRILFLTISKLKFIHSTKIKALQNIGLNGSLIKVFFYSSFKNHKKDLNIH